MVSADESIRVSVVSVCLNEGVGVERTLASILAQSYPSKQIIVIDGGSEEETLRYIRKFEDQLDVFVSESDGGAYDAMNKGIAMADGDYIVFINAGDEFYSPDTLRTVFSGEKIDCDILYGDVEIVDQQERRAISRNPCLLFCFSHMYSNFYLS